jgi:hypothetical protein
VLRSYFTGKNDSQLLVVCPVTSYVVVVGVDGHVSTVQTAFGSFNFFIKPVLALVQGESFAVYRVDGRILQWRLGLEPCNTR